jgi:hypothetical protein
LTSIWSVNLIVTLPLSGSSRRSINSSVDMWPSFDSRARAATSAALLRNSV